MTVTEITVPSTTTTDPSTADLTRKAAVLAEARRVLAGLRDMPGEMVTSPKAYISGDLSAYLED